MHFGRVLSDQYPTAMLSRGYKRGRNPFINILTGRICAHTHVRSFFIYYQNLGILYGFGRKNLGILYFFLKKNSGISVSDTDRKDVIVHERVYIDHLVRIIDESEEMTPDDEKCVKSQFPVIIVDSDQSDKT